VSLSTRGAGADIGAPLASGRAGPFVVQVLVSPTPLRAGTSQWNVLVSDARDGRVLPDAAVDLELRRPHPTRGRHERVVRASLRPENARNGLFHAALVELAEPGQWKGELRVSRGDAQERIPLVFPVASGPPSLVLHWRAFAVVPVGLALFALHQWLRLRERPGPSA